MCVFQTLNVCLCPTLVRNESCYDFIRLCTVSEVRQITMGQVLVWGWIWVCNINVGLILSHFFCVQPILVLTVGHLMCSPLACTVTVTCSPSALTLVRAAVYSLCFFLISTKNFSINFFSFKERQIKVVLSSSSLSV